MDTDVDTLFAWQEKYLVEVIFIRDIDYKHENIVEVAPSKAHVKLVANLLQFG